MDSIPVDAYIPKDLTAETPGAEAEPVQEHGVRDAALSHQVRTELHGGAPVKKLALITDAWYPQVNGVVRTLDILCEHLKAQGVDVLVISPDQFLNVPCPTYPEIRLAASTGRRVQYILDQYRPHAVHVATEGPLGLLARRWCVKQGARFSTSFHTKFPEYSAARWGVPVSWGYSYLRWFHKPSSAVMVATPSVYRELESRHFQNLVHWTRGVDSALFHPGEKTLFAHLPGPVFLYVGRVAIEKNIEAFLALDLPGSKVVVGDGPQLEELRRRYPTVHFLGKKTGEDLALHYRSADVFVFPSLTDTFGLVQLEALASGVPVAAYPVTGPIDVIGPDGPGALNEDLRQACLDALPISSESCRAYAMQFSWQACAQIFLENTSVISDEFFCA